VRVAISEYTSSAREHPASRRHREVAMKAIHWTIAAAALAFVQPAQAAQSDPEVIIYRFPSVTDDGSGPGFGVATVFHCTNFSGATENIRFVTRDTFGVLVQNNTILINHLSSRTASTHDTGAYFTDLRLATGPLNPVGTTAIAATSISIICTAETIDASTKAPVGVARHGIRFSPVPGSQE